MNNKTVIYVDIEDEITGIIDKVNSSKNKIVALVLPKRTSVFQSIVNMKLLQKKAAQKGKNVVLVTSDASILPLAGAVKMHVAKTLESEPSIPEAPDIEGGGLAEDEGPVESEIDNTKPVGELAGLGAVAAASSVKKGNQPDAEDSIELDNDKPSKVAEVGEGLKEKGKKIKSKSKGPKIPNFSKFRNILIIGALAIIALIVLWIIGFKVLPKATIVIQTNTSSYNTNLTLTLDSTASSLDPVNDILPAKIQSTQKSVTSNSVNTTGSKTVGTQATGNVVVTNNCANSSPYTIPAGTTFTDSSGSYSFTSNISVVIAGTGVTIPKNCTSKNFTTANVAVTATQPGSGYNIAPTSFSTSDQTLTSGGYQLASTSPMSGGSSSVVQVVSSADVTNAQKQITAPNQTSIEQAMEQSLQQAGLMPITQTFQGGNNPTYTPSANVGTQASTVNVTASYTYTMYGVKQGDLNALIDNSVNQQINSAQQSILDTGVSKASFNFQSSTTTSAQVTMQATSTVGAKLNSTSIISQSAGERSGDIKNSIQSLPGVTSVNVKYSPFWVTATPHSTSKIKVVIEKANGSAP